MNFLQLDYYNFDLPEESIAQFPLKNKNDEKLLCVNNGEMIDYNTPDFLNLLQKDDLLILNNTKVIKARLIGYKDKGEAKINITLHKRLSEDTWNAFVKNSKRLKEGDIVVFASSFIAKVIKKLESGEITFQFFKTNDKKQHIQLKAGELFVLLEEFGFMPLPPYVKRENVNNQDDASDYQSIFAEKEGAVAAPTASLHFTDDLMLKLKQKGVKFAYVTLHVGAGTFLPVKVENILDHKMHTEYGYISQDSVDLIKEAKANNNRVIPVGTTALRVIEYIASKGEIKPFEGNIDLFIYPGFDIKIADCLITNFHLPKSTLFMLVCAFAGTNNMKAAYKHAVETGYRFFSYGDGCFLVKKDI